MLQIRAYFITLKIYMYNRMYTINCRLLYSPPLYSTIWQYCNASNQLMHLALVDSKLPEGNSYTITVWETFDKAPLCCSVIFAVTSILYFYWPHYSIVPNTRSIFASFIIPFKDSSRILCYIFLSLISHIAVYNKQFLLLC